MLRLKESCSSSWSLWSRALLFAFPYTLVRARSAENAKPVRFLLLCFYLVYPFQTYPLPFDLDLKVVVTHSKAGVLPTLPTRCKQASLSAQWTLAGKRPERGIITHVEAKLVSLRSSAILPLPPFEGGGAKWQSFVLKKLEMLHLWR